MPLPDRDHPDLMARVMRQLLDEGMPQKQAVAIALRHVDMIREPAIFVYGFMSPLEVLKAVGDVDGDAMVALNKRIAFVGPRALPKLTTSRGGVTPGFLVYVRSMDDVKKLSKSLGRSWQLVSTKVSKPRGKKRYDVWTFVPVLRDESMSERLIDEQVDRIAANIAPFWK